MTQESPQGSIYEAFLNRVNERPDADFIYSPKAPNGSAFTFAEVNQISLALANYYLDAGITAGEKVILHLPNTPDFLFTFLALQRLGAVPIMALAAHRFTELSHFIKTSDAAADIGFCRNLAVRNKQTLERLAESFPALKLFNIDAKAEVGQVQPSAPELFKLPTLRTDFPFPASADLALLQLSGGSTGLSKLIPKTHFQYLLTAQYSVAAGDFSSADTYLVALPAAHNFPLVSPGIMGAITTGARLVFALAPSPDICLPLIKTYGVTYTSLVPAVLLTWLQSAITEDFGDTLRIVQVGGSKCPPSSAEQVAPVLGSTLQQMFGMAEGMIACTRIGDPIEAIVNSQGRPIHPDDEILIVDDNDTPLPTGEAGHLLVRGPYTLTAYYNAPEHNQTSFTTTGFYRTGDVVLQRPDGNLVVCGRQKDQINRGGEKISATEIEELILRHSAVSDVVLVAVPDEFLGEKSCALVVVKPEALGNLTPEEIQAFVRQSDVAAFKVPDQVKLVAELPLTAVGKISKQQLRSRLASEILKSEV